MHTEDKKLAKQMKRGNDAAFRLFFDDYFPRLYRFCCRRLNDSDAEEVTQAVLADAIESIDRYRGEASLFTWLCQIARNQISSHYRQAEHRPKLVAVEDNEEVRGELESLSAEPTLAPEPLAVSAQTQEVVQLILDHLPGDYGNILEWKYIYGYSVEEIAEKLQTSATAIQSKLARAREAFRAQYDSMQAEVTALGFQHSKGNPTS